MSKISVAALAAGTAGMATMLCVASATPPPADGPARIDYRVDDFETGRAVASVESSYDHQPQIERIPDLPRQRMVPIHKLPIPEGQTPEDRGFAPRPRCYAGFNGVNDTGWFPPDPSLAVGPDHVVEIVNATIAWFDKTTGTMQFSAPLDSSGSPGFFEGVGAGNFCFDTRAVYDDIDGRFVVSCGEVYSNSAWLDIAVSDDSDPNGTWYKYRTDAKTTIGSSDYWVDYPSLGFDDVGYYITGNLFSLSSGGSGGSKYRCFDKSTMLSGGTVTYNDLRDASAFSVQSGEHHDTPNAPFFISVNSTSSLKLQAITNPISSPSLVTTTLSVASFSSPPNAPNLGGSDLDTLDGRIINLDHRNKKLVCGHGVGLSGNNKATARWYEIKSRQWPTTGTPLVFQTGNVDLGNDTACSFPALCYDGNAEIAMTFAFSGPSEYAGIAYATHKTADASGVMSQMVRVKLGAASYNNFRWGDYFDCCPDPSDATKFWGVGEFTRSTNSWGTRIFNFDATYSPPTTGILMSFRGDTTTGGFAFTKGDVVRVDPSNGTWQMYFDSSDVLASPANIDALAVLPTGELLISFVAAESIPGLTGGPNGIDVDDSDIVKFTPTSLGEVTTGTWSFYFDGSDVGLDTDGEDIDALTLDGSGNLIISVIGPYDVGGGLVGKDEDLILFTPTSLGATTTGTWSMFMNGRDPDVKLGSVGEDVDAADFDPATNQVTISTNKDFRVPVNVTGHHDDLVTLTATSLGNDTAGTWAVTFDGSTEKLDDVKDDIDALAILR